MILINKLLNETKWTNELWQNKHSEKAAGIAIFFSNQYFNQPGPKNKTKSQMEFLSNNIVHI